MVERLSLLKARVVAQDNPSAFVIGADTTVVLANKILGKPEDLDDAKKMLLELSGREHLVFTGMSMVGPSISRTILSQSRIFFTAVTEREIEQYLLKGESLDKAGAYAFQGGGAQFVERMEGSPSSVIGLDLAVLRGWIRDVEDRG
jgi:septum formation protein